MKKTRVKGIDCGLVANIKARDRNETEIEGSEGETGRTCRQKGGQGEDESRLLVLEKKEGETQRRGPRVKHYDKLERNRFEEHRRKENVMNLTRCQLKLFIGDNIFWGT